MHPQLSRRIPHTITLLLAAVVVALLAFVSSASATGSPPGVTPGPNPNLLPACGAKVILVLDESGSISTTNGAEAAVRDAATKFASGLADTGSQLAVIEFGSSAKRVIPYTNVTSGAGGTLATTFTPYFNGTAAGDKYDSPSQLGQWTNWEDALKAVKDLNTSAGFAPLVVFVTDGDPTAVNTASGVQTNVSNATALTPAIVQANLVKVQGSHILTVGVGAALGNDDSLNRLIAISGPDVAATAAAVNLSTTDVLRLANFSTLPDALHKLVNELCKSSVTINKLVDNGQGDVDGGAGWEFNATVSTDSGSYSWITPPPADAGPRSASTGSDSAATFQWKPTVSSTTSTITVSETQKAGYQFVSAACNVTSLANVTEQALSITTNGASFTANVGPTDVVTCTVKNKKINPAISITKDVDKSMVLGGTSVNWTVVVKNTGDVPLTNVTVTDPVAPGCGTPAGMPIATLASGASRTLTCSTTVNIDTTNVASVTATDPLGNQLLKHDAAYVDVIAPALVIKKSVDKPVVLSGAEVTWKITVKNTGDTPLFNVNVTDPVAPECATVIERLDAGETAPPITCTATITVDTVNTARASATDRLQNTVGPVSDTAEVDVIAPAIDITKSVDKADVAPGTQVTYTITVRNTGDVELTGVKVADPTTQACDHTIGTLAAGASTSYTCVATINVTTTNVATATGTDPLGNPLTKSDDAKVTVTPIQVIGVQTTTLGIDKRGPATVKAGQIITYTIKITNTGKVTADNVIMRDRIPASMSLAVKTPGVKLVKGQIEVQVGTLAPGASKTITVKFRIDRRATGFRTNTAIASAANAPTVRDSARTKVIKIDMRVITPRVTG